MASTATMENQFLHARPTQRMGHAHIQADGDTWQEILAVVVKETKGTAGGSSTVPGAADISTATATGQLMIRSYFQNKRSGKRVWDEPPSGASHVVAATEEMHRMASVQLQELQIVGAAAAATTTTTTDTSTGMGTETKKKRGFLSFGFGKNSKHNNNTNNTVAARIRYKPGSSLVTPRPTSRGAKRGTGGTGTSVEDLQVQEAIAQSLGIMVQHQNYDDDDEDDEEMQMVKALSLSTAVNSNSADSDTMLENEQQLLARVMEESKLEQLRVHNDDHRRHSYHDLDRKMPAVPSPHSEVNHHSSRGDATATGTSARTRPNKKTTATTAAAASPYVSSSSSTPTSSFGRTTRRTTSQKVKDQSGLV
jgi:hypothetical protein